MFAESQVLRRLEAFKSKFGWQPTYHSIEEVDKWLEHLKSITEEDAKGRIFLKRDLKKSEIRFIQNERSLCALDAEYFLTRYYKISADNKVIRFAFRSGQRAFWKVLQELDEMQVSKEIQCLKARQQGISTLIEGVVTWYSLFVPGVKSLIASADGQKTQIMMGMMTLAIDMLPWWLPPTQTRDKRASDRAILEFSNVGSLIMVQSGSMRGGAGQGTTPTVVHLSEVCDFTDPVVQLEEGLFKAVHASPDIFMVLESTGNGNTGWWAEQWRSNKEFYWQGRSRLLPVFLPWFMTPELYPTPNWIQKFPIPESWVPDKETTAHAHKCAAYVGSTPLLQKVLGKNWTLPDEQKWFWEFNYQDHKRRRVEKSWLRQMPADDFEALQGHNDMAYGDDAIEVINSQIAQPNEMQEYCIAGEGIEKQNEPDQFGEVWYGEDSPDRLLCEWRTMKGESYEWGLIPMVRRGSLNPMGKVLIFEEPQPGEDYSIGCDTGTGVGGDRSIINVTRTGHDSECDVQVAEFASDRISNSEIYAWIAALSALYGKYMDTPKHPKIIIEQIRKFGDLAQHQLRLMGMKRMHEFINYDKKGRPKEGGGGANQRIGWYTNGWSRPLLLACFQSAIENGWYVVKSPYLAQELKDLEQKVSESGKTRMDHASGKHDDRVFAAAMAYFTMHHMDVMAERSKKRFQTPGKECMSVDVRPYSIEITLGSSLWR